MRQDVWKIWRLAWMRKDCIPYGGKIDGWTRLYARLFWRSGYSREWEIRCAYRQGWADGNAQPRDPAFGSLECEYRADDYLEMVKGR